MFKVQKWFETAGFYMAMLGFGFFVFSILTWRGFYLVERTSILPWMQFQLPQTLADIYWWNFAVLAITLISLVVGIIGLVSYIFINNSEQK